MGRILRVATSTTPTGVDFGTSGKLLLHVVSTDLRVAYDESMTHYFTLLAGNQYVLDQPTSINTMMWVATGSSTGTLEIWATSSEAY